MDGTRVLEIFSTEKFYINVEKYKSKSVIYTVHAREI